MSTKLKRKSQKLAEEAEGCANVPSRKVSRLENSREKILKSLTNSVNRNCPEFVTLNKRETLEKLDRQVLDKIKDFGSKGFYTFFFILFF